MPACCRKTRSKKAGCMPSDRKLQTKRATTGWSPPLIPYSTVQLRSNGKRHKIGKIHWNVIGGRKREVRGRTADDGRQSCCNKCITVLNQAVAGRLSSVVFIFAPMPLLQFSLNATDPHSKARAGKIVTDHGSIQTPIFMPVGTAGSVKAV